MRKNYPWMPKEDMYLREAHANEDSKHAMIKGLKENFNSVRTFAAVSNRLTYILKQNAKGENAAAFESASAKPRTRRSSVAFTPPPVVKLGKLPKGQCAFLGGRGVVISRGIENMPEYGGKFLVLEEQHISTRSEKSTSFKKHMIALHNVERSELRALHDRDVMRQVLAYIESEPDVRPLSGTTQAKGNRLDMMLRTDSISDQIGVALLAFGTTSLSKGAFIEKGERAYKMLAGEYAAVMGVEYKVAIGLFQRALNLKGAPELDLMQGLKDRAPV